MGRLTSNGAYTIVWAADLKRKPEDTCITVDAAIEAAKKASTKHAGSLFLVKDADTNTFRVQAWLGKAQWLNPCSKCEGTGRIVHSNMYGSPTEEKCARCDGQGTVEGLPCA